MTNLPRVNKTLTSWEIPLTLTRVTQKLVDFEVTAVTEELELYGVWQPLTPEQLELKPEGQRSWSWYWLHARSECPRLATADKVIYLDTPYKVMTVKDYSPYGYIEYHLISDYES